jgi:hypothetical protein
MAVQITRQLAEQHPEQVREQRAREVEPLLAEVVAVVELPALERGEQEPVDHVPEYAFFDSEPSAIEMCGSISFCRISCAYRSRRSRESPVATPRLPMKSRATWGAD